ncbi:hypothetical protein QUF70_06380 [Desulfobacterales bacterium HSG17]|nr:hypothetical protein [Desulfobacterales bacterium HSG17]
MQVIRKIIIPSTHQLSIKLPDEFLNKKIELLILPCNDDIKLADCDCLPDRQARLMKIYNESNGRLPEKYKFDREEAHER